MQEHMKFIYVLYNNIIIQDKFSGKERIFLINEGIDERNCFDLRGS